MNKFDTHIRKSLLQYPSLYKNRSSVLFHLFLVPGNGYEWVKGVLFDIFETPFDEDECRKTFFRDIDPYIDQYKAYLAEEDREFYKNQLKKFEFDRKKREFTLENIDSVVYDMGDCRLDYRCISITYGRIFNLPEKIEPSYKAGILEFIDFLLPKIYYDKESGKSEAVELYNALLSVRNKINPPDPKKEAWANKLITEILEGEK